MNIPALSIILLLTIGGFCLLFTRQAIIEFKWYNKIVLTLLIIGWTYLLMTLPLYICGILIMGSLLFLVTRPSIKKLKWHHKIGLMVLIIGLSLLSMIIIGAIIYATSTPRNHSMPTQRYENQGLGVLFFCGQLVPLLQGALWFTFHALSGQHVHLSPYPTRLYRRIVACPTPLSIPYRHGMPCLSRKETQFELKKQH